ncbi:hypothetical protein [Nitrospira sp. Nam74]
MESAVLGLMAVVFALGMWWKLNRDEKREKMKKVPPNQSQPKHPE